MSVISTGIDIIEINRIESVCNKYKQRFLNRIYTTEELLLGNSSTYLAGRWAAKEAVLKVLGTGLSERINWQDVSIIRNSKGRPLVVLFNGAAEEARRLGIKEILVSISHDKNTAIAFAIGFNDRVP